MRRRLARVLTLVAGWLLVLAGIAGLFLPFLQGFLLVAAGLYLLARESEFARSLLRALRGRYPEVDRRARELWRKVKSVLRRRP